MLSATEIKDIEESLKQADVPVAELCRRARIAETTWGRWKRGDFHPSYAKAKAVRSVLNTILTSENAEGDA